MASGMLGPLVFVEFGPFYRFSVHVYTHLRPEPASARNSLWPTQTRAGDGGAVTRHRVTRHGAPLASEARRSLPNRTSVKIDRPLRW